MFTIPASCKNFRPKSDKLIRMGETNGFTLLKFDIILPD